MNKITVLYMRGVMDMTTDANFSESPDLRSARSRLVKTAMEMFADRGYERVTTREIALGAGVSVGLINHHFESKEGLRDAVDRHFLKQFEEVLLDQSLSPSGLRGDSSDFLADALDVWVTRHITDWDISRAYMRRALLDGSEWGLKLFSRFYQIVRNVVDQMDARGNIRPGVDRLWLPLLMIYMELGTLLLEPHVAHVLGTSGFDRSLWRRRYRAYADLMMKGIAPSPESN